MGKKTERSICNIFFTTYKSFVIEKPRQYLFMTIFSLLPALVSPVKVYLEKIIFDNAEHMVSSGSVNEKIYACFFVFVAVQLLYVVVYPLFRSRVNYYGSEFETVLQNKMNKKTAKIPLVNYERSEFYKDIALASSASRELRFMTMMFSSEILLYAFQFLSVSTVLLSFHPALVILSFLAILPDIFAKYIKSRWKYNLVDKTQPIQQRKKYYESVLTSPESMKEVRIQQNGNYFFRLWNKERELYNKENWKIQKRNCILDGLNQSVNIITIIGTYFIAILLILRGEISIGAFGASLGAVMTLKSNFGRICNLAMFSMECGLKGKHYYKVLDSEERKGRDNPHITPENGIRLENVNFSYNHENNVLHDISFSIRPGEKIAIVGENGSGKTTLVKVLLGLFVPDSGNVYYGKDKINDLTEEAILSQCSAVFQDYCRYYLTVGENVAISDTEHPLNERKIDSLLQAVSFDFDGKALHSTLGREFGGTELSGGNWQKLGIARGFYKTHHLIALDEPTAALDPLVEEQVLDSMMALCQTSTKIFVTHRLNTTKFADRILVLDNGRIVGLGTHTELLANNRVYARLWKSQAKWYDNNHADT